jgi:hypothetical protein
MFLVRSRAFALLHADSRSRGFRQTFPDVTPGEADVFQLSIAEPTEDKDIRLTRPVRDCRGKPT